jgi:hypothetical protein
MSWDPKVGSDGKLRQNVSATWNIYWYTVKKKDPTVTKPTTMKKSKEFKNPASP